MFLVKKCSCSLWKLRGSKPFTWRHCSRSGSGSGSGSGGGGGGGGW